LWPEPTFSACSPLNIVQHYILAFVFIYHLYGAGCGTGKNCFLTLHAPGLSLSGLKALVQALSQNALRAGRRYICLLLLARRWTLPLLRRMYVRHIYC